MGVDTSSADAADASDDPIDLSAADGGEVVGDWSSVLLAVVDFSSVLFTVDLSSVSFGVDLCSLLFGIDLSSVLIAVDLSSVLFGVVLLSVVEASVLGVMLEAIVVTCIGDCAVVSELDNCFPRATSARFRWSALRARAAMHDRMAPSRSLRIKSG